jgi:integrase
MDTRVQGLGLRIRPSGAKTYIYYRRLPDNNESPRKICQIKIGRFEDVKLDQARAKATELNYLVGQGKDPSLAPEPGMTYGELFTRYIDEYAKLHTVTWEEAKKNHARHFGQFHNRAISAITREQVKNWQGALARSSGKHAANRNFNTMRAVFTWGLSNGLIAGDNPCTGMKSFKTTARERFIQPGDEFKRFATALDAEENITIRDFFWMCLFTGARCSNVLSMEWNQINMELHQWRIPVTKNGDSQIIPLTMNAMKILRERQSHPDAHPRWVFPSDRKGWKTRDKGHLVSPRKAFKRIIDRAGIKDLRIHDLRRTAGSYMAIQNVSTTIIGKALGHKSSQATAIYARLSQDPVRQAMENAQAALCNQDTPAAKEPTIKRMKRRAT